MKTIAFKNTALRSMLLATAAAFTSSLLLPAVTGADVALAESHSGKGSMGKGAGKGG